MKMTWYDPRAQIRTRLGGNLDDAAFVLESHAKHLISVQGPPPSRPGEPPHIDTAALIESVDHATDQAALESAVGSDQPHAVYTEFGTVHMDARPWLRRACLEVANEIGRTLGK